VTLEIEAQDVPPEEGTERRGLAGKNVGVCHWTSMAATKNTNGETVESLRRRETIQEIQRAVAGKLRNEMQPPRVSASPCASVGGGVYLEIVQDRSDLNLCPLPAAASSYRAPVIR
jgi:hypothetical protein